jgi:hypothetical protein
MPILTADNLETRSRQARIAIDGCTAAPATATKLRVRKLSRVKRDAVRAVACNYSRDLLGAIFVSSSCNRVGSTGLVR